MIYEKYCIFINIPFALMLPFFCEGRQSLFLADGSLRGMTCAGILDWSKWYPRLHLPTSKVSRCQLGAEGSPELRNTALKLRESGNAKAVDWHRIIQREEEKENVHSEEEGSPVWKKINRQVHVRKGIKKLKHSL